MVERVQVDLTLEQVSKFVAAMDRLRHAADMAGYKKDTGLGSAQFDRDALLEAMAPLLQAARHLTDVMRHRIENPSEGDRLAAKQEGARDLIALVEGKLKAIEESDDANEHDMLGIGYARSIIEEACDDLTEKWRRDAAQVARPTAAVREEQG